MSAQNLDRNGDGRVDAVVVPNADGTTWVFNDNDQNGAFELATVYGADGTPAVTLVDSDQNGVYDKGFVDQNHNGVPDLVAIDTDLDGVFDSTYLDANENGVLDVNETDAHQSSYNPGQMVGPVTNPNWFYSLMLRGAEETGTVTYGSPDSDGDGWYDNQDYHPTDPYAY